MNIAIYQPRVSYYIGGGEILPLDHGVFLKKCGHEVTIITTRASFIHESEYFKNYIENHRDIQIDYIDLPQSLDKIYEIKPGKNWNRWNRESLAVGRLARKYFLDHKFDVVSVYNVLDMCAIPHERKSVLHLLGYPARIGTRYRNHLKFPNAVIAVSKYVRDKWLKMTDLKKIYVAENGIASNKFRPVGGSSKKYDVLFIGRLIKIKGVDYLIKAVSILKKGGENYSIAIASDGPERNRLESSAKSLGLNGSIHFLGRIESDTLVDLYNSAKMTVLPSYDREGLLITMLESSSCGTTVITTTACSMKEFIKNGRNGILVKPKNARALANAINMISRNSNLRDRLSKNARAEIVKNWDWDIKIRKVERIYEKLLSGH